jgi:hypothetical protein
VLYPNISKSWRAHWSRVIPLFAFPGDIRKVIHTTNAIESVNMTLRKVTRNHRIFPCDEAVHKVVYLAMRNLAVARGRCPSVTGSPQWSVCNGIRGAVPAMMGKDGEQQKTRLQVKGICTYHLGNKRAEQVFLREQRFTFACTDG